MAVAKQAHLAHDRLPGAEITVFYMDVRAFGKGFEEFYDRVRQEGILYRRGNPSEILRRGDHLVVRARGYLVGRAGRVEADLVVLAVELDPRQDTADMAGRLNLAWSQTATLSKSTPSCTPLRADGWGFPGRLLPGSQRYS
jgi:heterodisulfide reductase subunit A